MNILFNEQAAGRRYTKTVKGLLGDGSKMLIAMLDPLSNVRRRDNLTTV